MAIHLRFIWFWGKFSTHFDTIFMLFGKFSLLKMAKYWNTQFGHLVTLQSNCSFTYNPFNVTMFSYTLLGRFEPRQTSPLKPYFSAFKNNLAFTTLIGQASLNLSYRCQKNYVCLFVLYKAASTSTYVFMKRLISWKVWKSRIGR